ncbi:MAG: hypothetical protein JXA49_07310 [Actinobacteria bacterium]|nr:hypothetical protein [Actinomycetota bacterium]
MKAIMHIDKVHPVIIAVILALLVVLLLPSGVLSELRGENKAADSAVKPETGADAVLSMLSWTTDDDGTIIHFNGFMWASVLNEGQVNPDSLLHCNRSGRERSAKTP